MTRYGNRIWRPSEIDRPAIVNADMMNVPLLAQRRGSETVYRIELNNNWRGMYAVIATDNQDTHFCNSIREIKEWLSFEGQYDAD